jgi:transcriptional regulator with GAF, ATPase, and Fis domain
VSVNAAATPRELIESELFGHAKGAFSGASTAKKGRFVEADGGTLFLDEIGELPLELQSKLLTALDIDPPTRTRLVTAVGCAHPTRVDLRIVFGTNRDLLAMAQEGRFRLDLLGRIATHQLALPPLAEARHRIPALYQRHLEELAEYYPPQSAEAPRFVLHGQASSRLFDFAFSPATPWPWNHRDVLQSVERLMLAAWARPAEPKARAEYARAKEAERSNRTESPPRRATPTAPAVREVYIGADEVEAEIEELSRRWEALAPSGRTDDDTAWRAVEERVKPEAWRTLSHIERWELRHLLEARERTASQAEAWRWIADQNLLPGAQANAQNPSNAFAKRWNRFRDVLRSTDTATTR